MLSLLIATGVVALAEMGDKTQLLALVLAARYKKPLPIIAGIFVATILNHALSAWLGAWIAQHLSTDILKWIIALSFFGFAAWVLVPDKLEDEQSKSIAYGPFVATCIAFFIAELGDKTQLATVALAAQYQPLWQVIVGTTLGMLLANVPVVYLGARFTHRLPIKAFHRISSALFIMLGIWVLMS
ncbi:MAG: TMEM165/GDT1 family protein [Arenimonas sp.]|nr:TMEM165/GDT1 family protein [Arenimonas sp.]